MIETIGGQYTIKQILQDHWAFFVVKHGDQLRPSIIDEINKVLACRDPQQQGYHLYRCPAHPEIERVVPHSCKSRFCSSCGKVMTDAWMDNAVAKFVDVPYRHIVWTIPDSLWNVFLWDRKLLDILFDGARETILGWCKERGFIPGIVMVVHTFGSKVNVNTHIHMLVTEGGLNLEKNAWVHNDYFPWQAFKEPWKYHVKMPLCKRMKEMIQEGKIGSPYRELGTGQPFRRLVGQALSSQMVRARGVEPCLGPIHHLLHRTLCETPSHGPKQDQGI